MKHSIVSLLILFFVGAITPASHAITELVEFDNSAQEARYKSLIAELRCLVCQNQNLADSNADLAKDLRKKTYDMIKTGASDDDIVQFMVDRYGEFVLYRPPLKTSTLLLWIGPFLVLGLGLSLIFVYSRRSRNLSTPEVDDATRQKIRDLLDN